MFIYKLHAFLIKSFRALLILPTARNFLKTFFGYNIMIKVNQHALINLVYSYMVTKVFNIQPVLFHQYYLCHLLWFKKQSFTLVWKPNPPAQSAACTFCWCSECRLYPRSACAESAQRLWSSRPCTCTSATTSIFLLGGGVVRLTAKPRYLLLLHRGNEKSNTVTALVETLF